MKSTTWTASFAILVVTIWAVSTDRSRREASGRQAKPTVSRPRPLAQPKPQEVPKEGELYIFSQPRVGLQTLLVLKVVDGETFEGAYLMPVRVKLSGVTGKTPADAKKLDDLIGGRLVNTLLKGTDASGNQLADVHFGAPQKDKPANPSGWLSDWLKKK